ncbi:MAG: transcriptional repressor [Planctomycetota bacterium]
MSDVDRGFDRFIRGKGLKLTAQRRRILTRVQQTKGHFTAEELHEVLRRGKSRISRATVYRTLSLLVDGGILECVDVGEGCRYFERARQQHDHMICLACGEISEFRDETLSAIPERLARTEGFKVERITVRVLGQCRTCRGE